MAAPGGRSRRRGPPAADRPADQAEFFETKVRPVLAESCGKCHGATKQASGLRLDSREALLEGGENGPAVVPGDPDKSLLVQAVRQTHEDIKMPPKGKLPDAAVEALAGLGQDGRPLADRRRPSARPGRTDAGRDALGVPAGQAGAAPGGRRTAAGSGRRSTPSSSPGSTRRGSTPSPEADRRTLIRRAHVRPDRPAADARGGRRRSSTTTTARRLRAAGRPPPRLARLRRALGAALARRGPVRRHQGLRLHRGAALPYSYTYRDYVIRAFNEDLPYDRFVIEQIAADRLGAGRRPRGRWRRWGS